MSTESQTSAILLQPRSHDDRAGRFMLVPILDRNPPRVLPTELWGVVFSFLKGWDFQWSLLQVSRIFNVLAKPYAYAFLVPRKMSCVQAIFSAIEYGEKSWSGVARTKYSVPGRWVRHLDVSNIQYDGRTTAMQLDGLLCRIFDTLPYLQSFRMNPGFCLSRPTMALLAQKDGILNLRSLSGISVSCSVAETGEREVPLLLLLQRCSRLEELELIGRGFDPTDLDSGLFDEVDWEGRATPLCLPHLQSLTLLSMPRSFIMASLLFSPLPKLSTLIVTPYDDIPYPLTLSSRFIEQHGANLRSLSLITPKIWPIRVHPSPSTLLETCPELTHLTLTTPTPTLTLPSNHRHLRLLSIPRPRMDIWPMFNEVFPRLPELMAVNVRDVRWLRRGLNERAQVTGVQGDMLEWRRRLQKRGVKLLDCGLERVRSLRFVPLD
ncbi:hypothetical protein DL96DRAFT_1454741 [Flagelloscypha sp. PMI_526]|nr:hypothetical protein DL96DRAFT_1454741 [Flagelloscypha sp. PMI_526]